MRRRVLMRILAATAGALRVGRSRLLAEPFALDASQEATLRALARAVLPRTLGDDALDRAAAEFLAWGRNYREGAEMEHGYGSTRLRWTAASPIARYPAQLAVLEAAAQARGGSFVSLPAPVQRELIEEALTAAKVEALPERPEGRHVAADLLAFFFRGSAANDLCYRARVGRDECRGLPGSEEPPEPRPPGSEG